MDVPDLIDRTAPLLPPPADDPCSSHPPHEDQFFVLCWWAPNMHSKVEVRRRSLRSVVRVFGSGRAGQLSSDVTTQHIERL